MQKNFLGVGLRGASQLLWPMDAVMLFENIILGYLDILNPYFQIYTHYVIKKADLLQRRWAV